MVSTVYLDVEIVENEATKKCGRHCSVEYICTCILSKFYDMDQVSMRNQPSIIFEKSIHQVMSSRNMTALQTSLRTGLD